MRTQRIIRAKKHQTARLNFIIKPAEAQLLKDAAEKIDVTLTAFIRSLAVPEAERILNRKVETF